MLITISVFGAASSTGAPATVRPAALTATALLSRPHLVAWPSVGFLTR
jgi:hypothetical protein